MFDTLWDKMFKLKLEETRLPVTFGKFGLTIEGSQAAFALFFKTYPSF